MRRGSIRGAYVTYFRRPQPISPIGTNCSSLPRDATEDTNACAGDIRALPGFARFNNSRFRAGAAVDAARGGEVTYRTSRRWIAEGRTSYDRRFLDEVDHPSLSIYLSSSLAFHPSLPLVRARDFRAIEKRKKPARIPVRFR